MDQITQNIGTGKLSVSKVPEPLASPGQLLIANKASVISAGTERSVMALANKSLLGKARERPDQVRRVLEKLRNEGFFQTVEQVRQKLDEPMSMGYSSAGVVLACGEGVQSFKPGDRVASNGPHAEVVSVPKLLCAKVPDNVPMEHAAFSVLTAIALQGVRLSRATIGETVLVVGLGLIGQLSVALLKASGVKVFGTDLNEDRCRLAVKKMGADVARTGLTDRDVQDLTRGFGADAVLITATTRSNEPVNMAAGAVKPKGRIVLVGVVGLELDRRPFYFKEAEFVVSCSYGPGRYDASYEEHGYDYPYGYVRWTEQRNIQSVLDLMAAGCLDVTSLITHRFAIDQAENAYRLVESNQEAHMGIVLTYPGIKDQKRIGIQVKPAGAKNNGHVTFGFIGAGNFARLVLLPLIKKVPSLYPKLICSGGGLSAASTGDKYGFQTAVSDDKAIFADQDIRAVFVTTRHHLHARQVIEAIKAGQHVFVEKPLALTLEEIAAIEEALEQATPTPILMVGFNRRFSSPARQVRAFFQDIHGPKTISVRFNAGSIPSDHWTQDDIQGGGRIIGEACHGIDLATMLVGSPPVRVFAESAGGRYAPDITDDQCFITLRHGDGSVSNIAYLAGGDKAFPKERVEVFGGGRIAVIKDFRKVNFWSNGKKESSKWRTPDKGHKAEIEAFAEAVTNGESPPMSWQDTRAVSIAAILAVRSIREGLPFDIP